MPLVDERSPFILCWGHVNRFLLADAFPTLNHQTFIESNSMLQRQGSTIQMNSSNSTIFKNVHFNLGTLFDPKKGGPSRLLCRLDPPFSGPMSIFLQYRNFVASFSIQLVRNSCLHLATGRTRDDIEKRIWQRRRKRGRNGREERG
ncbi:hypothetical protein TNCV_4632951 [Trichonephila clavipes]|nr:hypothetical protein TNCV_4632951 [Trichonephila clavipes]